jgi:hypothetical protein
VADQTRNGSENGSEAFESQLKEILDSGPDTSPQRPINPPRSTSLFLGARSERKVKPVLEIIIRVIAALVVIGLLIRFGFQVAYH